MKEQQTTKAINVEGLPQPVTHILELMVQTLKNQLHKTTQHQKKIDLPSWPGKPLGKMTRDEIYDDVV